MNAMQELMNDRILKEIGDLKRVQAKLLYDVAKITELVRDLSIKEYHEKDK